MRVLVAQAHPGERRRLADLLRQEALEPEEASTGEEALAALAGPDGPHLALIDRDLPGLGGVELCRRVRALALPVRPHLLLLTGRDARTDVVQALRAGADDHLASPPEGRELLARLGAGRRNVQGQLDLQVRLAALEQTLRRLEVAGSLAAGAVSAAAPPDVTLSPAVWSLEALRRLPGRARDVLSGLGAEGGEGGAGDELWAHAALGLPDQGAWLDLVLRASRAALRRAAPPAAGPPASGDQGLLDTLGDLLELLVEGLLPALEAQGVAVVRPVPARAWAGAGPPAGPRRLRLAHGDCLLTVVESAAAPRTLAFAALEPGLVLLEALHPPGQPGVEVLPRGTLLRASYLRRASAFFPAGAGAPVEVMPASALTLAQAGERAPG